MARSVFDWEPELMWMLLITTICTVAVVTVGLLIMSQLVKLEERGNGVSRVCLILALLFTAFWVLKVLVLPILICGLVWLKQAMLAIAVVLLIIVGIAMLLRTAYMRFTKQCSDRMSPREK